MGEVRSGHDRRLGREVAVKLLRADMAGDPEIRSRFEAEARAAARLGHPNVVAVFDVGEDDGAPFIVMERLPGETLADEIARRRLDADEARRLAREVLAALDVAHQAGLVHRDVKPSNVLRARDGSWKVADFGIAKSMEATRDLTATGMMMGTVAYLAPERVSGEAATPASDLYAVGVILYEGLAGTKPFEADTPIATAQQILAGAPTPLTEHRPDLDPALVDTVERSMAKEPTERFADSAAMAHALTRPSVPRSATSTVPLGVPGAADSTEARPATDAGHDADATVAASRPTRTEVLDRPPAQPGVRPRPGGAPGTWARNRSRLWIVVAVVAAVVVAIVVALSQGGNDDGSPGSGTTDRPGPDRTGVDGAPLPRPLDDALDRLAEAVQR